MDSSRRQLFVLAGLALMGVRPAFAQNTPLSGRDSALIVAAGRGDILLVQRLLAAGARVDARDSDGRTAILAATYVDSMAVVKRLIEAGANVNLADREGITPLSHAKQQKYQEIVRLLESAGAR